MSKINNFIILAGGQGSRFLEVDESTPKIIYPIFNQPFINYQINQILSYNPYAYILFSLGHKSLPIIDFINNHPENGNINYIVEKTPLGTGGAIKFCFDQFDFDKAMILNGDTYNQIPFSKMENDSSILVKRSYSSSLDKGNLSINDGYLERFLEKSEGGDFINCGVYHLEKSLLDKYNHNMVAFSLENDIFPKLINYQLKTIVSDADVFDIGTLNGLENFKTFLS